MTPLQILTLVCLNSPSLRDQVIPADFGDLQPIIERMRESQAASTAELQRVLKEECGFDWDGTGRIVDAIIAEQKELCRIAMVARTIDGKIAELMLAKHALRAPNIAGREMVLRSVEVVETTETK